MAESPKFYDDTATLTLSEVKQLKQLVKQVEANGSTINELVCLAENIRAAKRMWTIILGLLAMVGGVIAWLGIDHLAAFFGFRKA